MKSSVECVHCIIKKTDSLFCKYVSDPDERMIFTKEVLRKISSQDNEITAPFLYSKVMEILKKKVDIKDFYLEEKNIYNDKMLKLESDILKNINSSEDKLLAGLKYAMVGNFIDFGAMDEVDDKILETIIKAASKENVDSETYMSFKEEILNAKKLCYVTDNAGEIVFDKLFIKVIKELNKTIEINVIVRGEAVLNDATKDDLVKVGIDKYVNIIENGTAIPGTDLTQINKESEIALDESDLIISKGQGNFETLHGCKKNIYFLFLCKCDMFVKRFSMEKFRGVFMKEI